jgi:hypothetical protein
MKSKTEYMVGRVSLHTSFQMYFLLRKNLLIPLNRADIGFIYAFYSNTRNEAS